MTTLSEQEQAKAISKNERKRGKRLERAPKITLGNPFPKYWPQINEADAKIVASLLNKLLVKEPEKTKIRRKEFIKLSKEARKERMKELYAKRVTSDTFQRQKKYLKVGFQTVSRAIQHMNISSCLLAGDAQPDFMISHLVILAGTRGIPVLIVPQLKNITSKVLGFSSTSLGIEIKDEGQYLKPLDELIKRLCSQFPVPLHYAWIRDKTNFKKWKITKQACKARVIKESQKTESNRDTTIGDFFIDVAPGSSTETVIYKTEAEEIMDADIEFIPLNSGTKMHQLEKSGCQLYEDYMNNLLYIAPNFIRMQKNCNKQRRKKLLAI